MNPNAVTKPRTKCGVFYCAAAKYETFVRVSNEKAVNAMRLLEALGKPTPEQIMESS